MPKCIKNVPVYQVNSITEYMNYVKRFHLENCISRGENKAYPCLNAAAFRRNSSLDIQKMVNAFEKHIGNSLTDMQRKHFLAFSQHHGLPTNLLDFTFSPLISLYFACDGKPETDGYVYFIKKDRLINISEHLDLINSVFFPSFLIASEQLSELFNGITDVFIHCEDYIFEFLEYIDEVIGNQPDNKELHMEVLKILKNRNNYSIDQLDRMLHFMKKRVKQLKAFEMEIPLDELGSYGCLFVQLLIILIFIERRDGSFKVPFYFTYEPANITNRISNQSSIFIYQLYGINEIRQEIHPDFILQIRNKEELLKDLDCLGINEQFVFNDFDHIASYIKKRYLELSDEREKIYSNLKRLSEAACNK